MEDEDMEDQYGRWAWNMSVEDEGMEDEYGR